MKIVIPKYLQNKEKYETRNQYEASIFLSSHTTFMNEKMFAIKMNELISIAC